MKSLQESLLDNEDILMDNTNSDNIIMSEIKEYLKNYKVHKYIINKINDKYVVDVIGNIEIKLPKTLTLESLTNKYFTFGKITGHFYCGQSSIKSLKGAPEYVEGDFDCSSCPNLRSLEGAPKEVKGKFDVSFCKNLKSLKGAPKEVNGFICAYCSKLTSLEGGPEKSTQSYIVDNCPSLKSLKGIAKEIKFYLYCTDCGKQFTEEEVKRYSNVKYMEL